MAIVIKLKEYKADQEGPEPISPTRVLLGCLVGLLVVGVAFVFLGNDHARAASSISAGARAPSGGGAQGSVFARTNWGHTAEGNTNPRRQLLDTDLDCPEWEGKEDLKGLRAMAVCEIKTPDREPDESKDMAEEIFGVKG
jgi:hypothetical protein